MYLFGKSLVEIGDDVFDVFRADGQADGVRLDAGIEQFFFRHLGMSRACRVDYEGFYIGNVSQQGEQLEPVDEFLCFFCAAFDFKGEDGACAVGVVFLVEFVVESFRQGRMVYAFHLRMVLEVFYDFERVFHMAFYAQRERFQSLQQQESVERGDGSTEVAQQQCPYFDDESERPYSFREGNAVVAGVGFYEGREFAALFPIEFAAVDDDAAESGAVAADEFRSGMNDDIYAVFDRADEVRSAECIVYDSGDVVFMSQLGDGFDIGYVAVGVAERFKVQAFRIVFDSCFYFSEVVDVDESRRDAEIGQGVFKQVVSTAVDRLGCYDVVSLFCQCLNRVDDSSCAGSYSQCADTAFESSDALFKYVLCGIGQAAVNVAGFSEAKAVSCRLAVAEHVRSRLVNRHCACIGGRVGQFLSDMELFRLE